MIRDYHKYIVLKTADINDAMANGMLSSFDQQILENILDKIKRSRMRMQKPAVNSYVVVNEDQPYAEIVWKLVEIFEDLKTSGRLQR